LPYFKSFFSFWWFGVGVEGEFCGM